MMDADHDGKHIQGLLINMFHFLFPSLLKRENPFLIEMRTPIAIVNKGKKDEKQFYDEREYKEFSDKMEMNNKKMIFCGNGKVMKKEVQRIL